RERVSDTMPIETPLSLPSGEPLSDTEVLAEGSMERAAVTPRPEPPDDVTRPRAATEADRTTGVPSFASAGITQVGTTVGSPLYMAPEQWTDAALTSPRTDIYALGILC